MAENKRQAFAEKLILFAVFLVFAGIVVTFAFKWNYVEEGTSSDDTVSFQYVTSSKNDISFAASVGSSAVVQGKININTATVAELDTLPGIGEKKAQAIVDYRETESVFSKPEDIKNVSGIGDKIYEQIKDYIVVE